MRIDPAVDRAVDLAIGLVVGVVVLATTHGTPHAAPLDVTATLVAAVACLVLALRRRWPLHTFLVSSVAAEAYLVFNHETANGMLILAAPLIALYTVAESASRRRALTIGVLAVSAFAGLHMLAKPASWLGAENLALAALGGLAVAAGDGARSRREYLAEVEARALRAERDRDADARRRVTDERLRIARDLHDAVGHQLALINVQAGVAAHLLDAQPGRAREALTHVRHASRTALGELRDTIGLLRQPGDQLAPVDPVPGLTGLPDLLDTFRRSGLAVSASGLGDALDLPVPVDLTAYRVVQEALTNVCKHAGAVAVHLLLQRTGDALTIRVENAPAAHPRKAATPGVGLVGMRERVSALGGSLEAGPRPAGGYRLTAVLPLEAR
ncbi:sensor histidine kinase [Dactylosporangium sp. CA-152071]|uniref:sensor histidine kinase n=1 Tax=Dactylosporangium sp. CA-152071 TaxID=3239933 RepID=UPI003D8A2EBB